MAVTASGMMTGSVSGGCVEGAVYQEAQDVLAGGPPKRLQYGIVDEEGWEAGLACGGSIEVYLEPLSAAHASVLETLAANGTVGLVTPLDGGEHLVVWPGERVEGDTALAPLLESGFPGPLTARRSLKGRDVFVQIYAPPPTLTIVGAVHLAQPLVGLAQILGFRVRVVDARRVFATPERFPTADELVVAWPQEGLRPEHLRPQDSVVVLTHDPKFDVPAVEIALRSPVGYIGLLGSHTTQAKRRAALAERGFSGDALARIHGPVGLDLGGREPEAIALAILAEIVAKRK
jgi:xanthine dehydrogenase accessory factor